MTFSADNSGWDARLAEVVAFVESCGRLPGVNRLSSQHERRLARWVYVQRQHARRELISPSRRRSLDRALPAWIGSGGSAPATRVRRPLPNPQDEPPGI
ncbi:hypothetical protein GIS00_24630 [Nakamurella sp. YIM 132087]|uniref:Helicase-associated domain-containing protein n=1 Tax=Nakamurella alba TaxID=2665158 RepID=A0A7K1FSJ2_9ACTN|nr:hypothetical protein [Nakamurella alba]